VRGGRRMTLRFRLLLVYLMVVLLGVAAVGVAVFESEHVRKIYGALQTWNDMALAAQKLQAAAGALQTWNEKVLAAQKLQSASAPAGPSTSDEQERFGTLLTDQYLKIPEVKDYRNIDAVREALNALQMRFPIWCKQPADVRAAQIGEIRQRTAAYERLVTQGLEELKSEADLQEIRKQILMVVATALTVVYLVVIGLLLRRWLLNPMERLGRQVAALGRDEPPPEPLLTAPPEMADLARALDDARRSLDSLRQQLLESERLTTIGQLAAQLAHNLRNPLASIRAAAQLSARHGSLEAEPRQRMEEIVTAVDRMNRWIAGLMEVAKEQPTPVRPADVVPTLHRVVEAVRSELAAKDLKLALEAPPEGLVCAHDPATLEHALLAMVVNAIEASPLGGTIRLRAERFAPVSPESSVAAGPGQGGDKCRISVIDQGSGLPGEDQDRVFEFSYSTKQRGMGLGLALARQALRRQGGSAHAFNNPAGGATVYVELPLEPTRTGPPAGL